MTLVRSAGDGLPLDRWLSETVWPREALLTDEDVYWGMVLGAAELLCNGTTTTCEQYRHPGPVVEAMVDSGIRAMYTPGIFDVPSPGSRDTWERLLEEACDLFDAMEGREGRIHLGFGPHAAYTVPPEGLRAIATEAQRRNALLQIHLSETVAEGEMVRGALRDERAGAAGRVGRRSTGRVLAAHSVWLDDADLDLARRARRGGGALPGIQREAGGRASRPLRALLDRGVRVGLGTDGPASNDDLHLWDEMRLAAMLARAVARDPGAVSSAAALRLATRGGGEALGLPVGSARGGPARPTSSACAPTTPGSPRRSTDAELLGHLVWAGAGYLVTDVWVGGRRVVEAGRCTMVDGERARAEVGQRARRLLGS